MSTSHETLPAELYRSHEVYEREIDTVFRRSWACAGRAEYVAEPGAYHATDVAGQNIVIVRDHDGTLRAFHNVCRHRGALLCDAGTGTLKRAIKCPYHAWAYGLDGKLIGTPNVRPDEIDRSQYGLHGLPSAEWEGTLFVDIGGNAGPFDDYIASHDDDPLCFTRFNLGDLRIARTTTRDVQANWKIVVENYRECLHCPTVHPELVDMIPAYRSGAVQEADPRGDYGVGIKPGASALTLAGTTTVPPLPGLSEEEGLSVFGAYLFPNCMIDINGTYANLTTLLPRSEHSTIVVTDYLLPPDVIADPAMATGIDALVDFMEIVIDQDTVVAERTQQGIGSRAFDRGVYPEKDAALHAFNERYRQLVAGAE
jgi:Rieske 2Fe-2S family protein